MDEHSTRRTMRFRSKPSEVEAIQWDASEVTARRMQDEDFPVRLGNAPQPRLLLHAGVDGAQGWVPVPEGHWVVRAAGVNNDHWPVEDDYFRAKYQPLLDPKGPDDA